MMTHHTPFSSSTCPSTLRPGRRALAPLGVAGAPVRAAVAARPARSAGGRRLRPRGAPWRALLLGLGLLAACAEPGPNKPTPDEDSADDGAPDGTTDGAADGATDGAAEGTGDGAADGADDGAADGAADGADTGWPEAPEVARADLSLVADGALLSDGGALIRATAPAGIDEDIVIEVIITNRSPEALSLSAAPEDWLSGPGWSLAAPPPAALDPEQSAALQLQFNPAAETAAVHRSATLRPPVDGAPAVTLTAEVPRPLRVVWTGDHGYLATSDDYGRTLTERSPPSAELRDGGPIAWGGGRFFRSDRSGQGWFTTARYFNSADGLDWAEASYAEGQWVGGCAYALGRFACARGDVLSWSATGETVLHEATRWGDLLNAITAAEDRFVAVGRGGRRAYSLDGANLTEADRPADRDEYFHLTAFEDSAGQTILIAVGGTNAMLISRSEDLGETWTDHRFCESQYSRLERVAFANGVLVTTGGSNTCDDAYRSTDGGLSWSPVELSGGQVWGAANGAFLGGRQPYRGALTLLRSEDGLTWTAGATLAPEVTIRGLAIEGR
jgi:hypothetical protein